MGHIENKEQESRFKSNHINNYTKIITLNANLPQNTNLKAKNVRTDLKKQDPITRWPTRNPLKKKTEKSKKVGKCRVENTNHKKVGVANE